MTITDLHCDRCSAPLTGPEELRGAGGRLGVRFVYHPDVAALKDDSGLMCEACWATTTEWLGTPNADTCSRCSTGFDEGKLVVVRLGELVAWQLCRAHGIEFLNALRTVEPKLDAATFAFPRSFDERPIDNQ